ncbi:MAG: protein RecA [Armatimonadota bacterium]|jgi:recombination protein RecA|nr:MAG: protein RecA [Armatimonadota bacterium]
MTPELTDVIERLNRKYAADGKKRIGLATEMIKPRERIPTGCFMLDAILGGGIPMGVVTELSGSAGSGKTTMAMYTVAMSQRMHPDSVQVYISAEGPLHPHALELAKVDPSRVVIFEPFEYAERAMDALKDILKEIRGSVSVVVLDSVAALAPYMEVESVERSGMEGQTVGVLSRVIDKFYRVFTGTGLFAESAVIAVNQFRQQVGSTPLPPTVKGGMSSQYFPKLRIWLTSSPSRRLKRSDVKGLEVLPGIPDFSAYGDNDAVGHEVDVQIVKDNTGGIPFRRGMYRVIYGYGYDNFQPVVTYGERFGLLVRKGAYYQYRDLKVQGLYPFIAECMSTGMWDELASEVMKRVIQKPQAIVQEVAADEGLFQEA